MIGDHVVQHTPIHMIWHSTWRSVAPLKRKGIDIAKLLIAQYGRQSGRLDDWFDRINNAQILRRKQCDIRGNSRPDLFCERAVLFEGSSSSKPTQTPISIT